VAATLKTSHVASDKWCCWQLGWFGIWATAAQPSCQHDILFERNNLILHVEWNCARLHRYTCICFFYLIVADNENCQNFNLQKCINFHWYPDISRVHKRGYFRKALCASSVMRHEVVTLMALQHLTMTRNIRLLYGISQRWPRSCRSISYEGVSRFVGMRCSCKFGPRPSHPLEPSYIIFAERI
jgi:hypothetical protein